MNEEKLYEIAISDVSKYSLLNEILAIRDNRYPDEKVDYCINVNGYISLDVLNKYVRNINELEQLQKQYADLKEHYNNMFECHCNRVQVEKLQHNWNELKNGLKSLFEFEEGVVSKDYLECAEDTLKKMQELEQGKDE